MKHKYKIILLVLVIIIISGVWYLRPYGPMVEAESYLEGDEEVNIEVNEWLTFRPSGEETASGFIFYPGARVQPEAYAPLAYEIAKLGYKVVVVPMPLNLAVLGVNRAGEVIDEYGEITDWVIGGHSLGGAMAARFAYNNYQKLTGLILLASYPAQNNDLSNKDLQVLSIYGDKDGITSLIKINDSKDYLPEDTQWVEIKGGNHSQFGWYGFQDGDNEAQISRKEQQALVVDAVRNFLK